jgi:NADH:ubiquinone oxidoreductase subunit 4 (subunit M)
VGQVFFGKIPDKLKDHVHDIKAFDKIALVFLSIILIIVGIYPSILVPLVDSGVNNVLRLLGGA